VSAAAEQRGAAHRQADTQGSKQHCARHRLALVLAGQDAHHRRLSAACASGRQARSLAGVPPELTRCVGRQQTRHLQPRAAAQLLQAVCTSRSMYGTLCLEDVCANYAAIEQTEAGKSSGDVWFDRATPLTPRIPILAPRYIPRPTLFRICLPFGAVFDTLSRDRMMDRVSSLYAALRQRHSPSVSSGLKGLSEHAAVPGSHPSLTFPEGLIGPFDEAPPPPPPFCPAPPPFFFFAALPRAVLSKHHFVLARLENQCEQQLKCRLQCAPCLTTRSRTACRLCMVTSSCLRPAKLCWLHRQLCMHPCMASALAGQCIAVAMHKPSAQAVFNGVLCEARKRFSYQHEGAPDRSTPDRSGYPLLQA